MAFYRPSLTEEDFFCPICCDVFQEPVLLACSHSICKTCLQGFWSQHVSPECPICRTLSHNLNPPPNIVLRTMCEAILAERKKRTCAEAQGLCSRHGQELALYCLEEKTPVCEKCRDPTLHPGHTLRPVEEAAPDLKRELKAKLKPLLDKLKVFEEFKQTCDETAKHIKGQAHHTESKIKEEFEKLHQFLRDEETARINALKEDEEEKSQIIKKKIEEMETEISSLSDIVKSIEEVIAAESLEFLMSYKAIEERTQYKLQDPERLSGTLIPTAKYLGNLMFEVSKKMQELIQYTPVVLDPNTAHADLVVSEDFSSISLNGEAQQQLPGNAERFAGYTSVLGSEGFDSGSHSWEVEVGDSSAWAVGVITESMYRQRETPCRYGLWYVGFYNGKYGKGFSPGLLSMLRVSHKIQRISVQLNWEKGKVVFTDSARNICLHVFKHTFTERVFPYFYIHCKLHPVRILPIRSHVALEPHN